MLFRESGCETPRMHVRRSKPRPGMSAAEALEVIQDIAIAMLNELDTLRVKGQPAYYPERTIYTNVPNPLHPCNRDKAREQLIKLGGLQLEIRERWAEDLIDAVDQLRRITTG